MGKINIQYIFLDASIYINLRQSISSPINLLIFCTRVALENIRYKRFYINSTHERFEYTVLLDLNK